MTEELTDRFGEPPKNVQNLLAVAELKALAHCAYVTELKQMGDSVRVTLQQHAKIDVARIPELLQKYRDELKFQMESLAFVYTPRRRNSKERLICWRRAMHWWKICCRSRRSETLAYPQNRVKKA